jgi:hypothetical protein
MSLGKKKYPNNVGMLDKLIQKYYDELCEDLNTKVKIGDFLKMIELRQKLTPTESGKAAFWKMMENIRKENLPGREQKNTTSGRTKPEKTGKKKRRQA